ncbi:MAG: outer membrane lipoprotein-sorting protein [Candidatus Schekmanbacteria bacterium]|nr:outer membrane lipoprotein-sorting protein [Candidatus Schekmanbacteria bacterium]
MQRWKWSLFLILILAVTGITAQAQEKEAATEIMQKKEQAFYYPGTDMQARVTMELVTAEGQKRLRVLSMLRKNDPMSMNQKYLLYFHEPGDVRRTAFLVWKYPGRDDDRWIFIPAVNMVRRVAAKDSRSSFVGSDFTYEDVSGRDVSADTHTLLKEEKLGNVDCYVIQSVPKTPADYIKKLTWVDKKTFLLLKEEYYDEQNTLARIFTADKIENIAVDGVAQGIPTVIRRTMKNVKSGHYTQTTFNSIAYNPGLEDEVFSERALQNPPQKWIK